MLTIKTPQKYIKGVGIIKNVGKYVEGYGKRIYVVGSKSSLRKVENDLVSSLNKFNYYYVIKEFSGFPSENVFNEYTDEAKKEQVDLVIGIGGGRVLDTAKVVADNLSLPCVTIPTIAATCAAWAALSIVYDYQGRVVKIAFSEKCPIIIIVDYNVILSAPSKYLRAGIIDTLAKRYEFEPNLKLYPNDIILKEQVSVAQIAYKILTNNVSILLEQINNHQITSLTKRAVDAVIYLAGLSGSMIGDRFYGGFAHGFYNNVRYIKETHSYLHGEIIAFGLLIQFVVEERNESEIFKELKIFSKLQQPLTLKEIGIEEKDYYLIKKITTDIVDFTNNVVYFLKDDPKLKKLDTYIFKADKLGKKFEKLRKKV